jgi:hypothetical protein
MITARIAPLLPLEISQLRLRALKPQTLLPSAAVAWSAKARLIARKMMIGSSMIR